MLKGFMDGVAHVSVLQRRAESDLTERVCAAVVYLSYRIAPVSFTSILPLFLESPL